MFQSNWFRKFLSSLKSSYVKQRQTERRNPFAEICNQTRRTTRTPIQLICVEFQFQNHCDHIWHSHEHGTAHKQSLFSSVQFKWKSKISWLCSSDRTGTYGNIRERTRTYGNARVRFCVCFFAHESVFSFFAFSIVFYLLVSFAFFIVFYLLVSFAFFIVFYFLAFLIVFYFL